MISSLSALNITCANYVRPLALLLSFSLFTAALPVASLSQTVQPATGSAKDSSAPSSPSTQEVTPSSVSRQTSTPAEPAQTAGIAKAYGKLPLSFEANEGQFDPQVQFMARGGGYGLFLTSTEAVLVLTKTAAGKDKTGSAKTPAALQAKIRENRFRGVETEAARRGKDGRAAKDESTVLRIKLEGANSTAQAQGIDLLPGKTNYFTGNDPKMWHTEIPSYARVMYREVYPGVDIIYYGQEQQLEYDFVVAPGSDPNNISLGFEGAQRIEVDEQGDLVLHTAGGEAVRQGKPVVYQEIEGVKREIASRYVMKGSERVGFEMEGYDASKPLVIDPVLIYSTFLGGSSSEEGFSIAVDAAGNAYVAGRTGSVNFPVANPTQGSYGHNSDAFISKLNPDGSALIYSTYLGGGNPDRAYSIAIDTGGSAYVTGYTYSTDFPLMNPVQAALGGKLDAFVARLNPAGSSLVYSTYLGGSSFEIGRGLAIDAAGNAYVTGYTDSHDLTTANPLQAAKGGDQAFKSADNGGNWSVSDTGLNAAFVNDMAIDPSNPAILYTATELGVFKSTDGGSSWNTSNTGLSDPQAINGDAYRLAIDPANPSTIYAATFNAINKSTNGGNSWSVSYGGFPNDFFIPDTLVIDPINTSTLYASIDGSPLKSTNAGGSWQNLAINNQFDNPESITAFAVNPVNSSIVYAGAYGSGVYRSTNGGATWSFISTVVTGNNIFPLFINDLIVNPADPFMLYAITRSHGVYKSMDAGHNWSAINTGLPTFREIYALTLDPAHPTTLYAGTNGHLFKSTNAGGSWSPSETGLTNKDVSGIAIDPTDTSKVYVGTSSGSDAYITKLNTAGSSLLYSTYVGGNERDAGQSISLGVDDSPYLTGYTASTNFPTANPLQAALASPDSSTTDAFVTKLDASGASLSYSTYLGGNGDEQGTGIAVDQDGNAYVTGFAVQYDVALPMSFPVTPGAFQTVYNNDDAFVSKLNAAGSNLIYSTYLGGNAPDAAYAIAVNSSGQAFVTGRTYSTDFPLAGAIQISLDDYVDAFVTRLNTAGSALIFSTYLGGADAFSFYGEQGNGIAVDSASNVYVIGTTDSLYFPVTPNSLQRGKSGISDAFIAKIGAPPASVRISGQVLLNSTGLGGVTLTLKNGAGAVLQTTTTLNNGSYFFDVPGGGNYSIKPSKGGYQFNPVSRSFTSVGSNLTMQNFTATVLNFNISSRAVDAYNHGVPGVKFTLSGSRTGTCITGSDGYCTFNLPSAGNYTVTPSKAGGVFTPASKTFNNLNANQFPIFKTAFSISGQVKGLGGVGISGITVRLSGYRTATTKTDSNGNYTFSNVPAGANYSVTPMGTGVTFTPASKQFNTLISAQKVNFQGVAGITGKVKRAGTTSGISGVTVRLSGARTAATTTDANGFYTFANLPLGGNYTVTPSKTGISFDPPSKTFTNLKVGQTVSTASFVGTPTN